MISDRTLNSTWNSQLCSFTLNHDVAQSHMVEFTKPGRYAVHVKGYLPKNAVDVNPMSFLTRDDELLDNSISCEYKTFAKLNNVKFDDLPDIMLDICEDAMEEMEREHYITEKYVKYSQVSAFINEIVLYIDNVFIPDCITAIPDGFLSSARSVKGVYFGNNSNLTSIGASAFYWCDKIAYLDLPKSLLEIGNGAFHEDNNLKIVNIYDNLTSIGDGAFYNINAACTLNGNPSDEIRSRFGEIIQSVTRTLPLNTSRLSTNGKPVQASKGMARKQVFAVAHDSTHNMPWEDTTDSHRKTIDMWYSIRYESKGYVDITYQVSFPIKDIVDACVNFYNDKPTSVQTARSNVPGADPIVGSAPQKEPYPPKPNKDDYGNDFYYSQAKYVRALEEWQAKCDQIDREYAEKLSEYNKLVQASGSGTGTLDNVVSIVQKPYTDLTTKIQSDPEFELSRYFKTFTIRWTYDGGQVLNSDINSIAAQTITLIDNDIIKPWEQHIVDLLTEGFPRVIDKCIRLASFGTAETELANTVTTITNWLSNISNTIMNVITFGWWNGNQETLNSMKTSIQSLLQLAVTMLGSPDPWDATVAIKNSIVQCKSVGQTQYIQLSADYGYEAVSHKHGENKCDYTDCGYTESGYSEDVTTSKDFTNVKDFKINSENSVSELNDYTNPYHRIFGTTGNSSQYNEQKSQAETQYAAHMKKELKTRLDKIRSNPSAYQFDTQCPEFNIPDEPSQRDGF